MLAVCASPSRVGRALRRRPPGSTNRRSRRVRPDTVARCDLAATEINLHPGTAQCGFGDAVPPHRRWLSCAHYRCDCRTNSPPVSCVQVCTGEGRCRVVGTGEPGPVTAGDGRAAAGWRAGRALCPRASCSAARTGARSRRPMRRPGRVQHPRRLARRRLGPPQQRRHQPASVGQHRAPCAMHP